MAVSSTAPIEFEGRVKRFGHRAVLDDLSFTVPEGSVIGLLGPNGAGESTAMRDLLGLQKPTAGHARILGHEAGSPGFSEATRSIEASPLYKNASAVVNPEIRVASMGLSIGDAEVREIIHPVLASEPRRSILTHARQDPSWRVRDRLARVPRG